MFFVLRSHKFVMWTYQKLLNHYQENQNETEAWQPKMKAIIEQYGHHKCLFGNIGQMQFSRGPSFVNNRDRIDVVDIYDQFQILNHMIENNIEHLHYYNQSDMRINPRRFGGLWHHPDNVRHIYFHAEKLHLLPTWYIEKYSDSLQDNDGTLLQSRLSKLTI